MAGKASSDSLAQKPDYEATTSMTYSAITTAMFAVRIRSNRPASDIIDSVIPAVMALTMAEEANGSDNGGWNHHRFVPLYDSAIDRMARPVRLSDLRAELHYPCPPDGGVNLWCGNQPERTFASSTVLDSLDGPGLLDYPEPYLRTVLDNHGVRITHGSGCNNLKCEGPFFCGDRSLSVPGEG
ncbi:hypothetical protein Bbelb_375980 [Branchiostoma belcheri]|nr:hypothetical protein Bbelb_375980 [Branchiostoma belcheri]